MVVIARGYKEFEQVDIVIFEGKQTDINVNLEPEPVKSGLLDNRYGNKKFRLYNYFTSTNINEVYASSALDCFKGCATISVKPCVVL